MAVQNEDFLRIIPLGGVGEFGSNSTIIQTQHTSIMVDNGLLFPPDHRQPGVEYYVHDPDQILQNFPDLSAVIVSHGHEDHIGGLPFLLAKRKLPVYALPYTVELIRQKIGGSISHIVFHTLSLEEEVSIADLTIRAIGVTHSIAGACALYLRNSSGTVVHSGDFKVDPLPADDGHFQDKKLKEIGDEGVDILLVDSTNAHQKGFCPSEYKIQAPLEELIQNAPGRVFFTTFASHMPRIKRLTSIARKTGRKIVLMGRSFLKHYQISVETRYVRYEPDLFVDSADAQMYHDGDLIFVITGSQGERNSVLSKMARGQYQKVGLKADDTVILSSRAIPGNERVIALLTSLMESKGVRVITSADHHVHTSGHGFREDSAYLLSLVRPKIVVPFHGEFHHLLMHHRWLTQITTPDQDVLLIQNGDFLTLRHGLIHQDGHMPVRLLPIDGNQDIPIEGASLQDRKDMMYSGLIIITGRIDPPSKRYRFEVATHGMAEPEPGFVGQHIENELRGMTVSKKDHPMLPQIVLKLTKSILKEIFNGRPLIKIILNGKICV